MNEDANTAYVLSQVAVFNATIAGMVAENMQRQHLGDAMAYVGIDFTQAINESGLYHNSVLGTLRGPE